ncbi:hypothetical protein FKM82_000860 [Ascaphus truei]
MYLRCYQSAVQQPVCSYSPAQTLQTKHNRSCSFPMCKRPDKCTDLGVFLVCLCMFWLAKQGSKAHQCLCCILAIFHIPFQHKEEDLLKYNGHL